MATSKKKKEVKKEKKRLITTYEKLTDAEKDAFEEKYEDGFMDFVQTITRPDGTPMFLVPFETEDNIYMIKVDLRVDTPMTDEDFDKEILHTDKSEEDDITSIVEGENGKQRGNFQLKHGDYSSLNTLEEAVAREDMDEANFTSLDDIDDVADEGTSINI